MKDLEIMRIKEMGKKMISDFIRLETGSVGVKNAATIGGAFASAIILSQTSSEAVYDDEGNVIAVIVAI